MCFFWLGTGLLELIVVIYGSFVQPAINLQDVFRTEKTFYSFESGYCNQLRLCNSSILRVGIDTR